MGYALVNKVKGWITSGYGTNEAPKLIEAINAIRREWYAWYSEMNLFMDVEECFEVQRFCDDVLTCRDSFNGVTLPRHFAAVEAMWFNDYPVKLNGRWRMWHEGMGEACDCRLEKDDLGFTFPSERDLVCANRLRVRCFDPADKGKSIILRGRTTTGDVEETIKLHTEPQATKASFLALARPGGVIKDETAGQVVLADESGRVLSIYDPGETVPAYNRIRIGGLPQGRNFVNIRAARNYVEVFGDYDVTETDNQRAWEAMARYLRINRKTERTTEDLRSEGAYLQQARALLLGDKSREMGKSANGQVRFKTPNFGAHSLRRVRHPWTSYP